MAIFAPRLQFAQMTALAPHNRHESDRLLADARTKTVDIVTAWSGNRPEDMSQSLEDWWNQTAPGSTHSTLKFDPDGIDDLLLRLKRAFPASPRPSEADFRAGGGIKTVQDLADALQPVVSDEALAPAPAVQKKAAIKKAKPVAKKKAAPPRKVPTKRAVTKKKSAPPLRAPAKSKAKPVNKVSPSRKKRK